MAVRITRSGVGLTVGIIVLALVVLGGLYLAKERGEQARRADAIEIAQQNLDAQSGTGAITPSIDGEVEESGTPSEESEAESGSGEGSNGSSEESAGTGNENEGAASTDENGVVEGESTEQSPEELPQTGASETAAIIAIALLTFATASYLSSRRAATK